ncbi:MAG: twin transmembrane helix small protein [Alphaproteobacteria bacterium]
MAAVIQTLVPFVVVAVAVVLLLGLVNMVRAGPAGRSQTFMRWRVILQFVAVAVMMGGLYFVSR